MIIMNYIYRDYHIPVGTIAYLQTQVSRIIICFWKTYIYEKFYEIEHEALSHLFNSSQIELHLVYLGDGKTIISRHGWIQVESNSQWIGWKLQKWKK